MSSNYYRKLSDSILCRGKCVNYRDNGVSKKVYLEYKLYYDIINFLSDHL